MKSNILYENFLFAKNSLLKFFHFAKFEAVGIQGLDSVPYTDSDENHAFIRRIG